MYLTAGYPRRMTYLYAFNAEPDGIGIIADTRLTLTNTLGQMRVDPDQAVKVYPLGRRAFVGIAGTVNHVASILDGLTHVLRGASNSKWYDLFVQHCETRLAACHTDGTFSVERLPEVQLIYGDIRHKHGAAKCRLIRLEPAIVQGRFNMIRKTATKGQFLAIGWSPEGRSELNRVASDALAEVESRGLEISQFSAQEIRQLGNHTPNAQAFKADSLGPRTGNLRSQLRKCAARTFLKNSSVLAVEPVLVYCSIAQAAIEAKAVELRKREVEGIETVGDKWTPASLTLRHGFRAFNNGELAAISHLIKALG